MRVRRVGNLEPALVIAARQREAIILRPSSKGDPITVNEADLLPLVPAVGGLARVLESGELVELVALETERRATVRMPPRGSVLREMSTWDICEVVGASSR